MMRGLEWRDPTRAAKVSREAFAAGLIALIGADLVLAWAPSPFYVMVGVAIWGLHMGLTQGILSSLVADSAPADLRGSAYGVFALVSGVAALLASVVAGVVWDKAGQAPVFYIGAGFALFALVFLAAMKKPQAL